VGREREIAEVSTLLETSRLLTLTGPGGTGKTRLAVAVATAAAVRFPDGVCFVDLSALAEPALVPAAIARALAVREVEGTPLLETLLAALRGRRTLLLLDNFEQLTAAAPLLSTLLAGCPTLTLLVTSRVLLRLSTEDQYAVPPLPLPDDSTGWIPALVENPAVALFVQRAQAALPGFALAAENAATVTAIVRRLDGLPLAIELAAARLRLLSPAALLTRLESALTLLTGGARDLPARQQTLRNTIAWSYDLLEPAERTLFRRLAAFPDGCTLEAAEAVCDAEHDLGLDLLDGVSSLLDKSLLQQRDGRNGEPRFGIMQTIRDYALDRLAESGEEEALRQQQTLFYLALARRAERAVEYDRLLAELDNLRAVLAWCAERNELGLGARLAWALGRFFAERGLVRDMAEWVARLLALPGPAELSISRARLLVMAGQAVAGEDVPQSLRLFQESVAVSRAVGDTSCLGVALGMLAFILLRRDPATARPYAEEALALVREQGISWREALLLGYLSSIAAAEGDAVNARSYLAQAVAVADPLDDPRRVGPTNFQRGWLAWLDGDPATASRLMEAAVADFEASGVENENRITFSLVLARIQVALGEPRRAAELARTALVLCRKLGSQYRAQDGIEIAGCVVAALGMPARAAQLLAAAAALSRRTEVRARGIFAVDPDQAIATAKAALGDEAFAAAWSEGERLSRDEAIDLALEALAPAARV